MRLIHAVMLGLFVLLADVGAMRALYGQATGGWVPPSLPGGKTVVTDTAQAFITPPPFLSPQPAEGDYTVAATPPTIDFLYFPGQTYPGSPWSAWGNGCVYEGKYYCGIGDHAWRARVFEYDPAAKTLRQLLDIKDFLNLPEGTYTPGKLHGFISPDRDGWLYFATTRANPRASTPQYRFTGDWIMRHHPKTGVTENLGQCIGGMLSWPVGLLDSQRMLFYAGSQQELRLLVFDPLARRVVYLSPPEEGPSRSLLFSRTTGRVYYRTHEVKDGPLRRYDPATNSVTAIESGIDPRCASAETPRGFIYAIDWAGKLWRFDVNTEQSEEIGYAPIARTTYTTSLAVDPTGRYLYYCTGGHGGTKNEGTPIVQFDTLTRKKKVIAFLTPFYTDNYGCTLDGTFSMVISADGSTLFTTWNSARQGVKNWDVATMTVIHIPASERPVD
jgi:hypothetical protein